MKRYVTLFLLLTLTGTAVTAQVNVRDSSISTAILYGTFGYQFPQGDLAKQFGNNSSIGGGFMVKTKHNWLIGAEFNYLFSQSVKNSDSILKGITCSEGWVIDQNGYIADIIFYERGYSILAKFGKGFSFLAPNPNSGFTIMAGAGYLQDKIRIHNLDNTAPQVQGDYRKGYDRLNGGIAVMGSIGYMYMSNSRLLNFSASLEVMQAWTKPYREYDFSTEKKDTRNLSSQFYTIRVCWMIPLYKRMPKEYYVY